MQVSLRWAHLSQLAFMPFPHPLNDFSMAQKGLAALAMPDELSYTGIGIHVDRPFRRIWGIIRVDVVVQN